MRMVGGEGGGEEAEEVLKTPLEESNARIGG